MSKHTGPLYEMRFVISDEALADAEGWLLDVVRSALRTDGIEDARAFESVSDEQGWTIRTCQFQIRDNNTLDELLDNFFADIDDAAAQQFGDRLITQSRTLCEDDSHELPSNESPVCLNCSTRLRGQYCGNCGQRSRSRLISIWQLSKEAFGDLLELDSRLWQTVLTLFIRPGQLTKDYLEGRRARYMPPFRTYLVLSVVFFVVAFFSPEKQLGLFFDPEPEPTADEIAGAEELAEIATGDNQAHLDAAHETLKQLEAEGIIDENVVTESSGPDVNFSMSLDPDDAEDDGGFFSNCENASISDKEDAPEWLKQKFPDEKIQKICKNNKARGQDNFVDAMVDNIPVALIVLLPLLAMVLKVLYPLSRRFFVEHLLFFVHFHAFFFLMLILQILFGRLVGLLTVVGAVSTLVLVAASLYIPVYLYKAMRRVYGQGHLITILKYLALLIAYVIGAVLTLLGAFLVALLSV
jgi:hypothetical protein